MKGTFIFLDYRQIVFPQSWLLALSVIGKIDFQSAFTWNVHESVVHKTIEADGKVAVVMY